MLEDTNRTRGEFSVAAPDHKEIGAPRRDRARAREAGKQIGLKYK